MTWLDNIDDGGTFDFKKWAQKTGKFEGWEESAYRDTKGILTIGYGFNLEDPAIRAKLKAKGLDVIGMLNGKVKITQEQALPILEEIYKESYETARSKFSNFDTFPDEVKHTVTDMVYNMGEPTFDQFKKMKSALLLNDYEEASRQIADSSYAQQTGNRAKQHINTLLTIGNAPNVQPFMREKMEPIQIAPMREIKSVSPSSYEEEVVQVSPRASDVPETPQAEPKIDSTDTYVWTPGGKTSVKDFVKQYGKKVFESTFNKPVPIYKNGGLTLPYWKDLDKQYYINSNRTPREYDNGGPVKPFVTSNLSEYNKRKAAYADSLNLYNRFKNSKADYYNFIKSQGFDPSRIEEWATDGYVNTDVHPRIGATSYGILTNAGGGYNRDAAGNKISYTTYPTISNTGVRGFRNVPDNSELNKKIRQFSGPTSDGYAVYEKPVQEVIFEKKDPIIPIQIRELKQIPINQEEIVLTRPEIPPAPPFVDYEAMRRFSAAGYPMVDTDRTSSTYRQTIRVPKRYIPGSKEEKEYRSKHTKADGGWTDLNRRYGYYGQYPGYKNGGPTGTGSSQTDDKIVYEPYVGPEEEQKPGVVRPYGTNAQGETVYRPTTGYYLPEVEVSTDRPDTYNNYFLDKNRDAGLAYSMFMLPVDYALGFPQAYATKLLTGKYQLPSEAMGIDAAESPIKALAANAIFDPVNLLGVGLLNKEKALAALASSKESGLLSNTWRLNPMAYQYNLPKNTMWRGIGKSGLDDALESGVLRTANKTGNYGENLYMTKDFNVAKGNYSRDQPYGKGDVWGDDWQMILPKDSKSYIAEIPESALTNKDIVNNSNIVINKGSIPTNAVKLYQQDWLRGYKEVPKKEDGGTIYGLGSHVAHGGPTWPEYAMGLDSGATLHQTLDTLRGNPQPKILDTSAQGNVPKKAVYPSYYDQGVKKYSLPEEGRSLYGKGGMIKRADGSYSRRGLWDNIRANKGSGKKPTKQMLEQERKIRAAEKKEHGGHVTDEYKKVRSTVPRVAYTAPSTMGSGPWTQRGITFADGSYIGMLPMTNTDVPAPRYNKTPNKAVMPVVYANEPNTPDWSKGAKFEDGGWLDNI